MLKILALAAVLAVVAGGSQALACSVPFIRTFDNQTVDGSMRARTGKPCSIRLRRSRGPMHGAQVVQRPSNGAVSITGSDRVTYVSRAGFVGRDSFIYARRGLDTHNNPVVRTVRVAVTVVP